MVGFLRLFAFVLVASVVLTGCVGHPVRHLSSDVSMIKAGQSTKSDVLSCLGEPDQRRGIGGGREQWIYREENRSGLQNLVLLGSLFSGDGHSTIVVTMENDLVVASEFRVSEEDS